MSNNLPPGITDSMIPGNRPEDEVFQITLVFLQSDIDELRQYNDIQMKLPIASRHKLWATVANMVGQFDDQAV